MKHAKTVADGAAHPPDTARDVSGAVLAAFRDVLLEGGYARLTVRSLVARAGVARSTFYEHFDDKTDVLRQSIRPIFAVLANCVVPAPSLGGLEALLEHFADQRRLAAMLLRAPLRDVLAGFLAAEIEACFPRRLQRRAAAAPALLPPALAAAHIAGAQLALVEAWLFAPRPCAASAVARALQTTSDAMARELLGD